MYDLRATCILKRLKFPTSCTGIMHRYKRYVRDFLQESGPCLFPPFTMLCTEGFIWDTMFNIWDVMRWYRIKCYCYLIYNGKTRNMGKT